MKTLTNKETNTTGPPTQHTIELWRRPDRSNYAMKPGELYIADTSCIGIAAVKENDLAANDLLALSNAFDADQKLFKAGTVGIYLGNTANGRFVKMLINESPYILTGGTVVLYTASTELPTSAADGSL